MNQKSILLCIVLGVASFAFAAETVAQSPPMLGIEVMGFANNEATSEQAVDEAELDYLVAAIAVSASPPPGYIFHSIDEPVTTVFPNGAGTFDAIASGMVWFQREDLYDLLPPIIK